MSRDAVIRIDSRTFWLLGRLVKMHNARTGQMETPMTIDSLADDILVQWIKANKPKLIDLWERRKSIDDEALTL